METTDEQIDAIDINGNKLDIKLYWCIGSQPSRALLCLLEISNVKYESHIVDIMTGDHKKPEFLKINPKGTVPVLVINDKLYSESAACLRLLSCALPTLTATSYYPNDPWKRHAIDAALDFNGTFFRPKMVERDYAFFAQWKNGGKIDEAIQKKIDEADKSVHVALKALEDMLEMSGTKFCCGDEPTIADLQIYHQLTDAFWHNISCEKYPKVIAWRIEIWLIPSVKKYNSMWQKDFFSKYNYHKIPDGKAIELP